MLQQQSRGIPHQNGLVDLEVHAARSVAYRTLHTPANAPTDMRWEDLFANIVLPRLLETRPVRRASSSRIWHADVDAGAKLARVLLAPRARGVTRFVDSLLEQGASVNALYHEVFEPAQRQLGLLWDAERCDDLRLSIGMTRLGLEVRRVNTALPGDHAYKPGHSVLLCPQPGEFHRVGLAMSSEMFHRNGWDVTCEFPDADQSLIDVVHDRWFDVLKLSQSGSLRRDGRLLSMRGTIDAARVASLNPSLIVLVDGRTFSESPQAYRAVDANAACYSVLDAVPMAERLLDVTRSRLANVQVSAS